MLGAASTDNSSDEIDAQNDQIFNLVSANLNSGVEVIDTAELYAHQNEGISRALKATTKPFKLISKISGLPSGNYEGVEKRVQDILRGLGVEKVDTLLIHWPGRSVNFEGKLVTLLEDPSEITKLCSWDYFDENVDSAWENMVKLRENGYADHIGISNFYSQHYERLLKIPLIQANVANMPQVIEIFIDPTHHDFAYIERLQKDQIQVIAYRSVEFLKAIEMGASMGDSVQGDLEDLMGYVSDNSEITFKDLYDFWITICSAFGISVCVKSSNEEHIQANLNSIEKGKIIEQRADLIKHLKEKLPEPTEMSNMMYAFDAYAEVFASQNPS